ncbi:MAG: hypothetical protein ACRC62_24850 [Microcoleus sp.]
MKLSYGNPNRTEQLNVDITNTPILALQKRFLTLTCLSTKRLR